MTGEPAPGSGPRRASLAQDRSRDTRRRLIRAALAMWNERGFDHGVEETTVEEIAQAAGVTKGTFYFHFAHKEDILLELGWGTADALYEEAVAGASSARRSGVALLHQLLGSLARRVEAVPPAAVLRSVGEFYGKDGPRLSPVAGRRDIHYGLAVALELARSQGELAEDADPDELARMLTALAMDALLRWAEGDGRRLRTVLRRRADVLLAGAGHDPGPGRSLRRSDSRSGG